MNRKQCKDCAYFRSSAGGSDMKFCHHLLDTGKRRKVGENEICLSKTKKSAKLCSPFEIPIAQA